MLKGWFDRMFGPGIALDLSDPAQAKPMLLHIERIAGISTYGRPRWRAIAMCDPPRRINKRYLPWFTGSRAKVRYHALYHMNTASEAKRLRFLATVRRQMERFLVVLWRSRHGLDFHQESGIREARYDHESRRRRRPGNCRSRTRI